MKAVNEILTNKKNWTKLASLVLGTATLALLATACSNNSGGGSPAPIAVPLVATGAGGYGLPTCPSCTSTQTFISNAVADAVTGSTVISELDVYFYGSGVVQSQPGIQTAPYYGQVAATGRFYLAQALPNCNVPAGTYTYTTVTPGVFGANGIGTSFDNITLQVNGAPLEMVISGDLTVQTPPSVGQDGNTYPYRMMLTTFVIENTSTPGMYCNLSLELQ
jgi:hypothetical protein